MRDAKVERGSTQLPGTAHGYTINSDGERAVLQLTLKNIRTNILRRHNKRNAEFKHRRPT
jgi:hypothetical protein